MDFLKRINFEKSWSRFPLSSIAAIVACLLLIYLNEIHDNPSKSLIFRSGQRFLYALMVLFGTSLFSSLWSSRNKISSYWTTILPILATLVYWFILPNVITPYTFVKHIAILLFLLLLLVPWLYPKKSEAQSFWSYFMWHLGLIVETTLFSFFVFLSISVAILALEELFGLDFSQINIYLNLFILIASGFFPLYFMSRIELPHGELNQVQKAKVLNIFGAKILLPIVYLYALILASYFVKILVQGSWPRGWVSNLILWFIAFGVPSYFINKYLNAKQDKPLYVSLFIKYFFYFLLICSIVLAMAVQIRVKEYGITENRYVVLAMAIWVFILSLYFILSKIKDLRFIPISLSILILVAFFSPISIFKVPIISQFTRFKNAVGLFDIRNESHKNDISDLLEFLDKRGSINLVLSEDQFKHIKKDSLNDISWRPETLFFYDTNHAYPQNPKAINEIAKTLGFEYTKHKVPVRPESHFNFFTEKTEKFPLEEYDELILINSNVDLSLLVNNGKELNISYPEQISIPVDQIFSNYHEATQNINNPNLLIYKHETVSYKYTFMFRSYRGNRDLGEISISEFKGFLFIKSKS